MKKMSRENKTNIVLGILCVIALGGITTTIIRGNPHIPTLVNDGEAIKVEAEDLKLIPISTSNWSYIKSIADDVEKYPDCQSSSGSYVADIFNQDKMDYSFIAQKDGYVKYIIAGVSNAGPIERTPTPTETYDMYLNKFMKVNVNSESMLVDKSLKFDGFGTDSEFSQKRAIYYQYQEVELLTFPVEKGIEYTIDITFVSNSEYIHSYNGKAFGNYDYIKLQYCHYE